MVPSVRRRGRGEWPDLTAVPEHTRGTARQESGSGKYLGSDPGAAMPPVFLIKLQGLHSAHTSSRGSVQLESTDK